MGEEAAGRRAEMEALRRSLSSSERERERLDEGLRDVAARIDTLEREREGLEADIERVDGQTSPLADRRTQLEQERRALTEKIEELDDVERRHRARIDLLEARRRDIEETAGSRFLGPHAGRAIGLLRDLVSVEPGLERALVAALGPLADAVVYDDADRAIADAPEGDGAIFAIAKGGPVALGLRGRARAALRRRSGAGRTRHREHRAPRRLPGRHRGRSGREAGRAPGRVVRHAGGRA